MNIKKGSIIRMHGNFKHIEPPNMEFDYKIPYGKVAICAILDIVNENDIKELSIYEVMRKLGWKQIEEE